MQFHYRLIVHQKPSNFHIMYNGFKLTVFDGLSNDNKIVWNVNDHQSKCRITHLYKKKSFLRFCVCVYLEIHCQSCQNNSLSVDLTLIRNKSMEPIPTKYFDADDPTCQ
jgi:hypothetical protein